MRLRHAAALAVVAVLAVALAPSFTLAADKPQDLILGKWKPEAAADEATLEFAKDGKVKISAKEFSLDGTYKFIDDNNIAVKLAFGGQEKEVKLKITVTKDELTTQEDGKEKKETFKRVK